MAEGGVEFENPEFDHDDYEEEGEEDDKLNDMEFHTMINRMFELAEQSPKEERENIKEEVKKKNDKKIL